MVSPNYMRVQPNLLSLKLIPAPHREVLSSFGIKTSSNASFGLVTCDRDHSLFVALDEATKASPVNVVYARSFYAGSKYPSGSLSGEAVGILGGADDAIVREGLKAVARTLAQSVPYYQTDEGHTLFFFPHVISSLGSYLSKENGLQEGESLAYLIAPPIESILALDAALKAADVRMVRHFAPPTATNVGGGLLTGTLDDCQAAAQAFRDRLIDVAQNPIDPLDISVTRWRPTK